MFGLLHCTEEMSVAGNPIFSQFEKTRKARGIMKLTTALIKYLFAILSSL